MGLEWCVCVYVCVCVCVCVCVYSFLLDVPLSTNHCFHTCRLLFFLKELTYLLVAGVGFLVECSCLQDFSFSRTRPRPLPCPSSSGLARPASGCPHQVLEGVLGRWEPLGPVPLDPCTLMGTPHGVREKGRQPVQVWVNMVMGTHIARASSSLYQSLDFQSCIKYKSEAQMLTNVESAQ